MFANLVAKNFKTTYRRMALGFLWSLLNPLVLVVVLSVVWRVFFGAARDFPSFVLIALIPFNFFTHCVQGCTQAVVGNSTLVKKVAFPRQILPLSVVVTHLFDFAVQVPLLAMVMVVFPPPGAVLTVHLLWLPVIFAVQLALVTGLGLLVASANVMFRDMRYIVESTMFLLFWASPILYDAHDRLRSEPPLLYGAYYLNPLAGILESYRSVVFHGTAPHLLPLGLSAVVTSLLLWVGLAVFRKFEGEFADLL